VNKGIGTQATVGNVVYDLPNRPTAGPIRLVQLAVAQPLHGLVQIARQDLQFRNPSVESSRADYMARWDSVDPCSRDQRDLVFRRMN
jgi:hypothetical protein